MGNQGTVEPDYLCLQHHQLLSCVDYLKSNRHHGRHQEEDAGYEAGEGPDHGQG